jgi:bacterioferritin (cytochrome b1)
MSCSPKKFAVRESKDEDKQIDCIESQLEQIEQMGLQVYLSE